MGFVEVFNKVLVKMVHTAVMEHKDLKKVVQKYLASYRATKLPSLIRVQQVGEPGRVGQARC